MSYMFVPHLEAIGRVTSVLGPENRPASLAQKAVSVKNGLSTTKNISYGSILRHPFIPTNPLLAAMRLISFFPFFSS